MSRRLKYSIKEIKDFAILEKKGLCLSDIYINNKTNLTWKCGKCNHVWNARLDRVKATTWCPKCNQSYGEKK